LIFLIFLYFLKTSNINIDLCCYPIFDPYFDKFSEKNQKKAKNNENPKKCIFDIFASF